MPFNQQDDLTFVASSGQNSLTFHGVSRVGKDDPSKPMILRIYPVDAGAKLRSIDSDQLVFGRNEDCEVVIDENLASRRHAKIVRKGDGWFLVDLGSTNGTWVNEEKVQIHELKSGDRIRVGLSIFKFFNEDNVEAHYHESVYQMMTQDALTGAWNKRYLNDVLEREVPRHRRSEQPLGLLMIDFDEFKEINDCHGHIVGDEVLAEFGRRTLAVKRSSEVFARFGGDEFVIVFVNSDREASRSAAERIFNAVVSEPFDTSSGPINCSFSGGFSVLSGEELVGTEELLEAADQNLYQAKDKGGNQIVG